MFRDMKTTSDKYRSGSGFSLAEVVAALMISAMVLVAVLGVYSRVESAAASVTRKLDNTRIPYEILQRITEDIDRIVSPSADTKVTIENRSQKGYHGARMTILKTIFDRTNRKKTFERIVWQSAYDYETDNEGLVLYRSHSGVTLEDKLLDKKKEKWETELFIPMFTGITYFAIQVPAGEELQDKWTSDAMPNSIVVTISFAKPFKTLSGTFDVADTEKIVRTVAVDRVRKIKFVIVEKGLPEED